MLPLAETVSLVRLYLAGAPVEALARVFSRDPRTVRKTLRHAGVVLRPEAPLPHDWRAGLSRETLAALQTTFTDLGQRQQAAWHQVQQTAQVTATGYTFARPQDYATVRQTAQPPVPLPVVAQRLGLDLTRVLLAYADWLEQWEPSPAPGWRAS